MNGAEVTLIALSACLLILVLGLITLVYLFFDKNERSLKLWQEKNERNSKELASGLLKVYQEGLSKVTADRIAPTVAAKAGEETRKIVDSKYAVMRQDFGQLVQETREAHTYHQTVANYVEMLINEVDALKQTQSSCKEILDLISATIRKNVEMEADNCRLNRLVDSQQHRINEDNMKQAEQSRALEEARSTEAQLQAEINAMAITHDSKVAELENTHAAKVAKLNAECEKLLAEKDIQMQNRETELQDAYRDFTQPDIANLFGFSLGDSVEGGNLKTVVYSYLAFLGRNMRENDFIRRFGIFDQELYYALRDDSDALEACRRNVERHIATWNREGCKLIVEWAQLGSVYDDELDNTLSGAGSRVDGVMRARIFAVDELGNKVCMAKGQVETV